MLICLIKTKQNRRMAPKIAGKMSVKPNSIYLILSLKIIMLPLLLQQKLYPLANGKQKGCFLHLKKRTSSVVLAQTKTAGGKCANESYWSR